MQQLMLRQLKSAAEPAYDSYATLSGSSGAGEGASFLFT